MTKMRELEIIAVVNKNGNPKELNLNEKEQKYYNKLIAEKNEFKARTGIDLTFTLPTESYNDLF